MLGLNIFLLCLGLNLAHEFRRVIGEDKPKIPGFLSSSGFINVGPANISIFVINNGDKKEGNDRPKSLNREDATLDNLFNPFERTFSGRANDDLDTKSHTSIFGNILMDEMMNTLNDPGFLTFSNKILSSLLPLPRPPPRVNSHHHRHPHRPLISLPAQSLPETKSAQDNPQQLLNSVVQLLSKDLGGMSPKKQPGSDALMMFEIIGMPDKMNVGRDHPFQRIFPSLELNVTKPKRVYKNLETNSDLVIDKSENIVPEIIMPGDDKTTQTELNKMKPKPEAIQKEEVTIRTVKKDMAEADIVTNEINTERNINIISKSTVAPDMSIPLIKAARS